MLAWRQVATNRVTQTRITKEDQGTVIFAGPPNCGKSWGSEDAGDGIDIQDLPSPSTLVGEAAWLLGGDLGSTAVAAPACKLLPLRCGAGLRLAEWVGVWVGGSR
jgi:hypothetical protein